MSDAERTTPAPKCATPSSLYDLLPGDTTFTVAPLHFAVTQTFTATGMQSSLHVLENGDLGVQKYARDIVAASEDGALLIGFSVDGDHDELHWRGGGGADCIEMLRRGVEVMTLALAAAERAVR